MGPDQNFLSGLGKSPLGLEKKFPVGSKKISASWVKKCPGQRWVGSLFTAVQKYAWVGEHFNMNEKQV